jgi:hypothetical protein
MLKMEYIDDLNAPTVLKLGKTVSKYNPIDKDISSDAKFKSYLELYFKTESTNKYISKKLKQIDITKTQIRNQICFIVDATGSMNDYIVGTKKEIKKFIDNLHKEAEADFALKFEKQKDGFELVYEVAIVAYRDFGDSIHFETHDFTTDISSIEDFLGSLKASGGGDEPEDVKGAFIHSVFGITNGKQVLANPLSWNDHGNAASRTIMWLADSPPHGKKFYGKLGDDYPTDDNDWDIIFDKLKELDISLYITKLNSKNDRAFEAFESINKYNTPDGKTESKINLTQIDVSQAVKISVTSTAIKLADIASSMCLIDDEPDSKFDSSMAYNKLTRTMSEKITRSSNSYVKSLIDPSIESPDKIYHI